MQERRHGERRQSCQDMRDEITRILEGQRRRNADRRAQREAGTQPRFWEKCDKPCSVDPCDEEACER